MPRKSQATPEGIPRVIVMGATGSGKSTFIGSLVRTDIGIGHGLESCTKYIVEVPIQHRGREIVLVDTPGFNDTNIPDIVVLKRIASWMKKKYTKNEAIIGVIYLHKISENRFNGRNHQTFRAICGDDYIPRICLATTFWAEEGTEEYDDEMERYESIKNKWWEELINNGAQTFEVKDQTQQYPVQVLDHILGISQAETKDICLQLEIARDKKKLHETSAGQVWEKVILGSIKQLEGEIELLREQPGDEDSEQMLELEDEIRLLKDQIRLGGTDYPTEVDQTDPFSRLRLYPKQWNRNW